MKRFISVLLIFVIIFSLFSEFVSADITVFITKTGTKYHYAGCKYLKSSSPISLSTALARGYTPCSECVLSQQVPKLVSALIHVLYADKRKQNLSPLPAIIHGTLEK